MPAGSLRGRGGTLTLPLILILILTLTLTLTLALTPNPNPNPNPSQAPFAVEAAEAALPSLVRIEPGEGLYHAHTMVQYYAMHMVHACASHVHVHLLYHAHTMLRIEPGGEAGDEMVT